MGANYSVGQYVEEEIKDDINIELHKLKKKQKKQQKITPITQPSTLIQHSRNINSIIKNTTESSNNDFEFIENLMQLGLIQEHNNMKNKFMITDFKRKLDEQNKQINLNKELYNKKFNDHLIKEKEIKFYNKSQVYLLIVLIILVIIVISTGSLYIVKYKHLFN